MTLTVDDALNRKLPILVHAAKFGACWALDLDRRERLRQRSAPSPEQMSRL